jgi:hypothetical protein
LCHFCWAAENGHLDIVKWLHEHRIEGCTTNAMDNAAGNGHLDIVKWLHEYRTEGCSTWAFSYAIRGDHNDIIEFLYNNYKHLITKVTDVTYMKLLPFIQEKFKKTFVKIEKENMVRDFIAKKLVYHPTSSYMKRIVDSF